MLYVLEVVICKYVSSKYIPYKHRTESFWMLRITEYGKSISWVMYMVSENYHHEIKN